MAQPILRDFDTRVVRYHLRTGDISPEAYQEYLDSLPDDAEEAVEVEVKFDNAYERRTEQEEAESDED